MIDAVITKVLLTALSYGLCGTVVAMASRILNRKQEGPRLDQTAAIGFLIGASFGAFFGIFQALLVRPA